MKFKTLRSIFPRRLNKAKSVGPDRPSHLPSGLKVVGHEPEWVSFEVGVGAEALEITGRLEGLTVDQEKSVIARVRAYDAAGASLDAHLSELRTSAVVGRYFLPIEYARNDEFRFTLPLPTDVAKVDVGLQHWRKRDTSLYGWGDLAASPVDAESAATPQNSSAEVHAADGDLHAAEKALKAALRRYAEQLASKQQPLYEDEARFGEPLAEYILHHEKMPVVAKRLAGRRLRAGRDLDAIGLIGLCTGGELEKAHGRHQLHQWVRAWRRPRMPKAVLRSRTLVYLTPSALPYDNSGDAVRTHGVLRGYQAAGWTVHAFVMPGGPADSDRKSNDLRHELDGVTYQFLVTDRAVNGPDQIGYVESCAEAVLSALGSEPIGLVQAASFFHNAYAGRLIADRLKAPLVYEMRGMEWLGRAARDERWIQSEQCRILRDLEVQAAMCADHVLATTPALGAWLNEQGVKSSRISLLPNGVDADSLKSTESEPELGIEPGLAGDFTVAYFGSFSEHENVPGIVSAVSEARRISGRDIRLLLVGDGQAEASVYDRIARLSAEAFVVAVGRRQHAEMAGFHRVADAIIMARRNTLLAQMTSPTRLLEALAWGKPVISTDVPGVRDILSAADAGILVPANAPAALAHAIAEAAERPDGSNADAERGRAWVLENRTWAQLTAAALSKIESRFADHRRQTVETGPARRGSSDS